MGGGGAPGQVQVSMVVQGYMFPETDAHDKPGEPRGGRAAQEAPRPANKDARSSATLIHDAKTSTGKIMMARGGGEPTLTAKVGDRRPERAARADAATSKPQTTGGKP